MGALATLGMALLIAGQAGYGAAGQPCYPNATCDQGLRCEQAQCVVDDPWTSVGGLGQTCFPNQTCREGLACQAGLCTVTPAAPGPAEDPATPPGDKASPAAPETPPPGATAPPNDPSAEDEEPAPASQPASPAPPQAAPDSTAQDASSSSNRARKVTRTRTARCQKTQPDGGISWSACGGAAGVACGTAAVCGGCGVATAGAALLPVAGMIAIAGGVPQLAALPLSVGMYCGTLLGVGAMACGFPASAGAALATAGGTRWFVDYDFNDFLFFMSALLPATLAGIALMVGAVVLGLSTVALLPFLLGALPFLLPIQMVAYYGVWSLVVMAVATGTMTMTIPALITLIEALLSEEEPDDDGEVFIEVQEETDESEVEDDRESGDAEGDKKRERDSGETVPSHGTDRDVRASRCGGPPSPSPVAMTTPAPMRF